MPIFCPTRLVNLWVAVYFNLTMQTERCLLQPFTTYDQAFVFEGLSNPEVIRYYGVQFHSYDATQVQMEWFQQITREGSGEWWKIVDREKGTRLGAIGINNYQPQHRCCEIGYWLLPQFWGQGLMREVVPAVLDHLFVGRLMHRVSASVEGGNTASSSVLESAGFRFEGIQRECEYKGGRFVSLLWYSLLEQEWRERLA